MPRLLAVLIACLALVIAACGDDSPSESADATPTEQAAEQTPEANATLPEGCQNVEKPAPKPAGELKAPKEELARAKTYVATIATTCGDVEVTLDSKASPITGGSFKYLADQKFFDGTTFHRIEPNFVIQGGDPNGDGTGGPGYSVEEAPDSDLKYEVGVVAMAKTQTEAPGTSGSQFFIVTGDQALTLTPDYAYVGKVTKGMDVVKKIGGIQPDPATGGPAAVVIIKSIKVSEE